MIQQENDMMKEIISEMVGGTLEGELDDELGYALRMCPDMMARIRRKYHVRS